MVDCEPRVGRMSFPSKEKLSPALGSRIICRDTCQGIPILHSKRFKGTFFICVMNGRKEDLHRLRWINWNKSSWNFPPHL